MAFTLTDTQQVNCTIKVFDKKNNPARITDTPTWLVDNPNVLVLSPSADGLSCLVKAVGPLGTGKVSVNVTIHSGGTDTSVAGVLDVEVVSSAPTTVSIDPGTPSEQS